LRYAAHGAVGIGESPGANLSGITVSAINKAINKAINNATGKWVLDYPTTPDKALQAPGKIWFYSRAIFS
jgi:CO/xanthine dehydrogenase Mo-binding subunit